ncbi:MAG: hypothetical protein IT382_03935 [Deltaproteobacteria bacterium]|nr:hypothetical protein [Deltaproteobacteria bacterium]
MPIERYRDVADMPPPARLDPADPSTWARIRALWHLASCSLPPLFAPGVTKGRSIEELSASRERAEIERMRKVRDARR